MSRYFKAKIAENRPLNSNHNLLSLVTPDGTKEPLPGQFFMVEVNKGFDPILKRAFSLFRRTSDGFQILYRIIGKGTSVLRSMKEGTEIDVLGPLGNHFRAPKQNQIPLIIAGGIGIASVFPLIRKLEGRAYVFYGARTGKELFMLDELKTISKELVIATDDGSAGEKDTIIGVLNKFLKNRPSLIANYSIYSCGPRPMLEKIAGISAVHDIKAYVSLEENMACGIGACLGCVVKTVNGHKRVCREGPVFDIREIEW
ncbi:MAG: dihydroorotate dehydrogenase electron transfer subunit [Nitrospirota bacterium]